MTDDKREGGGFFRRLKAGIEKTQARLSGALRFGADRPSPEQLEELEEALLEADVGMPTITKLMEAVEGSGGALRSSLASAIVSLLESVRADGEDLLELPAERPRVWLMLGVNGAGKTTTAGKLAQLATARGLKVLLVAGDTFRAAANEQLEIWAKRSGASFVGSQEGADAAAAVFDGIQAGRARGVDLVIVDTAGRLHTKTNLMQELEKVVRVAGKAAEGAPHQALLVLDGTTGRNAFQQAKQFASLGVTGVVVTKIDGTARGGAVLAIAEELKLPVCYVGVGESADDLLAFDARAFADALLGA